MRRDKVSKPHVRSRRIYPETSARSCCYKRSSVPPRQTLAPRRTRMLAATRPRRSCTDWTIDDPRSDTLLGAATSGADPPGDIAGAARPGDFCHFRALSGGNGSFPGDRCPSGSPPTRWHGVSWRPPVVFPVAGPALACPGALHERDLFTTWPLK